MNAGTRTDPRRPAAADAATQPSASQLRILDAAAEAFMARGYDATSIDDIADRIGATKGAVYYSYRSKMDIFLAVYERGMIQLGQRVAEALDQHAGAPAAERLRTVAVAHAENIMRHYAYHVVIQHGVEQRRQMALRESERDRIVELDRLRERHESVIEGLITEGHTDRSIRPWQPRLATRTVLGGIVGIAIWYRPRPDQTEEERHQLAGSVVDILLSGLVPEKSAT